MKSTSVRGSMISAKCVRLDGKNDLKKQLVRVCRFSFLFYAVLIIVFEFYLTDPIFLDFLTDPLFFSVGFIMLVDIPFMILVDVGQSIKSTAVDVNSACVPLCIHVFIPGRSGILV